MATQEPLVRFYDLSGPKPWSPACWVTRYALNFKGIPYTVTKLSYPGIKPKCEELLKDMTGLEATVPIIEILQEPYKALNDSTPIAKLLNERFTEADGYKHLKDVEKLDAYEEAYPSRGVFMSLSSGDLAQKVTFCSANKLAGIVYDVWANALDPSDGSKEYFKETREKILGMPLKDLLEVKGGGEELCIEKMKSCWVGLQERMKNEGTGEPTYLDFFDASIVRWVEAASHEKYEKLLGIYGDDTFIKLMKKVSPYEA
ncbi:uncharacterized protein PAC_05206 [Phialocephala subalpina]|uniref:Uncharacterized protein n=1 Tax=Phialocephala subalpina TaxID=576137 RepID=A0A1L7WRD0_9HELO|nr:uncharacterized protein PAC_05206 [Phialocephala subalpina]